LDGRALVLGGGGVTGIAWETGLLAGLAELGIDLAAADVIIGTSAGSVVGADIAAGQELAALYRAQLAPPAYGRTARLRAIGHNVLDLSRRAVAATAGRAQAAATAAAVRAIWQADGGPAAT
jgi:NTE family protein